MEQERVKARLAQLRAMLVSLDKVVDYQEPGLLRQADQVDMVTLESYIERLIDRSVVLCHAFDVMKNGSHRHPMGAILHSLECMWPDCSDEDFMGAIQAWSRLVGPAAFSVSTIQMPDGNSAGTFSLDAMAAAWNKSKL